MGIEQELKRLATLKFKGVYSIGTTAPRAPWNKTGKRIWHATDRAGREVAQAATPKGLERALRKEGR